MKRSILVIFTLCSLNVNIWSQAPKHELAYVAHTAATPANCIEIPSKFSNENIYDAALLRSLKNKEIATVELWYTRYKQSPTFDQVKLNETRVKQLQVAYPELRNPNIKWVWKEQTEAYTREEAAKCFHGFRIFTTDEQPLWVNGYRVDDLSNQAEHISVDNSKGAVFQAKSGSIIHIPAMAVLDAQGNPVSGNYTIDYTEYRDPAQIAFSGLPMNFLEQGTNFAFNSAGMYEIRGYQNNQPLQLQEAITVDFNCTDQIRDLNFYALDQQTGNWLKRTSLDFNEAKAVVQAEQLKEMQEFVGVEFVLVDQDNQPVIAPTAPKGTQRITTQEIDGKTVATLSDVSWQDYQILKEKEPEYVEKHIVKEDSVKRQLTYVWEDHAGIVQKIFSHHPFEGWQAVTANAGFDGQPVANNRNATLLGDGSRDPGHSYPNMIKGLNSDKFGVYNCDQQYRMGKTLGLQPTYVDRETGKTIGNQFVTCVIDRGINGSFSYDPKWITISKLVETELILFTKDQKVYHVSSETLKNLPENGGATELKMKDISDQVKTSEDLKKYLNL